MYRIVLIALGAVLLAACARENRAYVATGGAAAPLMAIDATPGQMGRTRRPNDTLAYEHTVTVEVGKELLAGRLQDVQIVCASNKDFACTVLDMNLQRSQTVPSGSIRMRMLPAAVTPIIEIAAKGGEVASRASHAEDLAEPVADTERELSMLLAQREKLEGFLKSKDLKIDQMITLSKELSSVQAQIDSTNTQKANLRRRIDTELLTIQFQLPPQAVGAEQTPVRDALGSFGTDLTEGVGMVISFVARLLPWLVIGIPGIVLLRIFWRAITRWLVRREVRAAERS